jgi:hypothetical protein
METVFPMGSPRRYIMMITLFLWDTNAGPGPPYWGSLESEPVKYGHESRGTRTRDWLRCRGPTAIVNDRPILSSETMLRKDCNRKSSVEGKYWSWVSMGLAPRRIVWKKTASRKVSLSLSLSDINRIEGVSWDGSRKCGKKGIRCERRLYVCCSDNKTVINPLPG